MGLSLTIIVNDTRTTSQLTGVGLDIEVSLGDASIRCLRELLEVWNAQKLCEKLRLQ